MTDWSVARAPSLDDFAALAEAALAALPQPFRRLAGEVRMRVADFADDDLLEEMGIADPFELTGVYHGQDLAHRSVLDPSPLPPEVLLFRRPILDEWAENGETALGELITHVLVHEIGHHFGLSDADIEAAEGA
jgi:predicted Zn-dependent protease with MMP-like domain